MTPVLTPLAELNLGDVVRLDTFTFADAIVRKINKEADGTVTVTVFRPYGVTADFSYTGGVICYTGVEDFTLHGAPALVVRKGDPLK